MLILSLFEWIFSRNSLLELTLYLASMVEWIGLKFGKINSLQWGFVKLRSIEANQISVFIRSPTFGRDNTQQ